MDVAYAFLNHHHSIWINGEQFCIWHSYFTDNMQNLFTYTHIDCLIYRKGEKNDAKNAPFTWTRTEPKAENLVQLIESKVSFVVPFNSDCELRLCRARFSQESLGMFNEVRGIPPRSYWRHLFNGENIINQWRKYRRCNRCSCPGAQTLSPPSQQLTTWVHHEYVLVHPN